MATIPSNRPTPKSDIIPGALSLEHKEAAIRMCYCPDHWNGGNGTVYSCPVCVRSSIRARRGADALRLHPVHLVGKDDAGQDDPDNTICGLVRPFASTPFHPRVTCPDCLIVDYMRSEGLIDNDPAPLPPKWEPAEPPHSGPKWEHDCPGCIYLGSRSHYEYEYDLYYCPPNKFSAKPNLVARRGVDGDYVSGLDWVEREPMLAVAAILALREGHLSLAVLRGN